MTNTGSAQETGLATQFEEVRRTLLEQRYSDRLGKPLEYWVLPSDRRLPLALLGRTVGELLSTSFSELSATPGIGEKKINSLVKLLNRATSDEPPTFTEVGGDDSSPNAERGASANFDANVVSEALWTEWREAARRFAIGDQPLGRLAPSLERLPTVIWNKPLGEYLDHTLAEIRSLRTHGEKRVRCVLEVFHTVYHKLSTADETTDLDRLLMPAEVCKVQDWVLDQLEGERIPVEDDIRENFALPLLSLIEKDCGSTVAQLVDERLGLNTESRTVREQARQLGVTRARVYQLLDDCGKVMSVRWPEGKALLGRLTSHYSPMDQRQGQLRLFFSLCEICFPEKQLGQGTAELLAAAAGAAQEEEAGGTVTAEGDASETSNRSLGAAPRNVTGEGDAPSPALSGRDASRSESPEPPSAAAKGQVSRMTISTSS